jgi:hypothetical protein
MAVVRAMAMAMAMATAMAKAVVEAKTVTRITYDGYRALGVGCEFR